jgi:hypothetical protein
MSLATLAFIYHTHSLKAKTTLPASLRQIKWVVLSSLQYLLLFLAPTAVVKFQEPFLLLL